MVAASPSFVADLASWQNSGTESVAYDFSNCGHGDLSIS